MNIVNSSLKKSKPKRARAGYSYPSINEKDTGQDL